MEIGIIVLSLFLLGTVCTLFNYIRRYKNIPTSLYYEKITDLQTDIENLNCRKKMLNPMSIGFDDKVRKIDSEILKKKNEIKLCKRHIKIEDLSNKY